MSNCAKWFRVRVTDLKTGKIKSNVKIPISLTSFGMKMLAKYAPNSVEGLDWAQVITAAQNDGEAHLVDVEDKEKGERVEVFTE